MSIKILIVEDNDMNLDMLSRRLIRKGYEIIAARDGQAAIDTALAQRPDLVLMDMSLPVLDGWEATKAIRGHAELAGLPVIALTAHAMESDRQSALDAGCNDFHTKPIDLAVLLEQINGLVPHDAAG
ncbi:response regulator [Sulfitobacter aestuarii]|uniref:Response regulator n=1 Tax=Sulfitobacter aestuarii TaxID=2161676 RepID=A0ABW5U0U1_9RHOB